MEGTWNWWGVMMRKEGETRKVELLPSSVVAQGMVVACTVSMA
jgi:preprotein translocase subunit Sec61beta